MAIEIKVPMLPESITDATIMTWHKKVGEMVKRDHNLLDLETDKVVLEVPAPEDGSLSAIKKQVNDVVKSGDVVAIFEPGAIAKETTTNSSSDDKKQIQKPLPKSASLQTNKALPMASDKVSTMPPAASTNQLSPSRRRMMAEQDLVSIKDVSAHNLAAAKTLGQREQKRVPMSRLRQRIASRLLDVKQNTAMLTTFNEIDMSAIISLKAQYKQSFEKTHGVRLGFMSFFTMAALESLKRFPDVNAAIDGSDIVYHNYFDIGVAVSTDRGLVVPILRDVDAMTMAEIERQIRDFAKRGRDGKLTLEEMTGGNFTITNGGVFGSMLSTPILNPPQSAILGMHNIVERPIAKEGNVVIRPIMYVALSYDHRIIDGKTSVLFLTTIKALLEQPAKLLLAL